MAGKNPGKYGFIYKAQHEILRMSRVARKNGLLMSAAILKMQIWVDADACPNVIKEILFKTAERMQIPLTLVANQALTVPRSKFIKSIRVPSGFDIADNEIVKQAVSGDLVITADIPLAAAAVAKGAYALNPRGEFYTAENIRERLNLRDFMDTLRASGVDTGGPAAFSLADRRAFANELDRFITLHLKSTRR